MMASRLKAASERAQAILTPVFTAHLRESLLRFVQGRVEEPNVANVLTQQILLSAAAKLSELRDPAEIESWLCAITLDVVQEHSYHRPPRPTESGPKGVDAEGPTPGELKQLRSGVHAYIRRVVHSLPPIYRTAIEAVDYEGLSQADLAARIGLSLPAANSRVRRARSQVRRIIEECCRFGIHEHRAVPRPPAQASAAG